MSRPAHIRACQSLNCPREKRRRQMMEFLMQYLHSSFHQQKTPGKTPTCKVCNKEFKSRTILYRHRQTHMEKTIQCGVCQKLFSTVSQVQSHQAKLKHEKVFKCAPCNMTFTAVMDLKVRFWMTDTCGFRRKFF